MAIARQSYTEGTGVGTAAADCAVASCVADDTIVIVWAWFGTQTISVALACSGETVTARGSVISSSPDSFKMQWATIDDIQSGGTKTITGTLSGAPNFNRIRAWRITGADLTAPMDATPVGATGNGTSASVNITTATANAAIFSLMSSNGGGPTAPGSGFALETVSNDYQYIGAEYDIDVGAAGSKAVGYTIDIGDWGNS